MVDRIVQHQIETVEVVKPTVVHKARRSMLEVVGVGEEVHGAVVGGFGVLRCHILRFVASKRVKDYRLYSD